MAYSVFTKHSIGDNLYETFLLYWLDAEINTSEHNKTAQEQIRCTIKDLLVFDDQTKCRQALESLSANDRLILIVSGRLGREFVPQIHDLQQLRSIYVYCHDKTLNEAWAKNFKKIKSVITILNELIMEITFARNSRVKVEQVMLYNIYSQNENSTVPLNDDFIRSLILINALLRFEYDPKDKLELISSCKHKYKHEKHQLHLIDEFNDKYTSDKAVYWYTRESFFYQMLHQCLSNIQTHFELLLLFRCYLSNICEQITQNQHKSPVRVYYGRIMDLSGIHYLKDEQNRYLSIKSFLLTNTNRIKVLQSLNNTPVIPKQEKPVLFIIDARPNAGVGKSYTDISQFSHFIDEGEILFTLGCIFRWIEVKDDEQLLTIRLELCNEDEDDLKPIYESMKKAYDNSNGNSKIDFRTFGHILHRIGNYDFAEQFYHRLLSKFSSNDISRSDIYRGLAEVTRETKRYDVSLNFYKDSLKIKERKDSSDIITIGQLYGCIGNIYRMKDNDKKAFEYFTKAIHLYQTNQQNNHIYMADFQHHIASIYKRQSDYEKALECYKEALRISEQYPDANRLGIAKSHNSIGNVYYARQQYKLAHEHYEISLTIKLDILPPQHESIAKSYRNLAFAHKMMNDLQQALVYCEKSADIYRAILPSRSPDVLEIENEILNLKKRLS